MDFIEHIDAIKVVEKSNLFLKESKGSLASFLDKIIKKIDKDILLWLAFDNNHLTLTQLLIEKGADVNIANENHMTSLHIATVRNNEPGVTLLLCAGANPDVTLLCGETPLLTASRSGWNQIAYQLLQAGANPNLMGAECWTPLMAAVFLQNYELAFLLLQFNADPNLANDAGNTPIFYSLPDNHVELTQYLLKSGAKLEIRNHLSQTPDEFVATNQNQTDSKPHIPVLYLDFYRSPKPIHHFVTKFGGQPVWLLRANLALK